MQSREKDSAAVSAYPCDGRTSDHTLSGSSLVFPLALLLCVSAGLFGWSLEAYDAFIHLPVLFQWQIIVACSLFALGFAATVREFRSDWHERWAARVVGAAGVAFLVAFSFRISVQVDRLQNQIAVRGSHETNTPMAQQIVYLVAEEAIAVETPSGRTVSWTGPLSVANRRAGIGAVRYRDSIDFSGPADRRTGGLSAAPSGPESAVREF